MPPPPPSPSTPEVFHRAMIMPDGTMLVQRREAPKDGRWPEPVPVLRVPVAEAAQVAAEITLALADQNLCVDESAHHR